jgi:hypothetical protein
MAAQEFTRDRRRDGRLLQEAAGPEVVFDQLFEAPFKFGVPGTGLFQQGAAFALGRHFHGGGEDRFNLACCRFHGHTTSKDCLLTMRKKQPEWLSKFGKNFDQFGPLTPTPLP